MKDVTQHTYGIKRGCLVSFGNRWALIWISQNCHCALFRISPERFSSSPPFSLYLFFFCPYHVQRDVRQASSQDIKLNLQPSPFKSLSTVSVLLPLFSSLSLKKRETCWDMNPFYGRLSGLMLKMCPQWWAGVLGVRHAAEYSLAFCLSLLAELSLIMKSRGERLAVIHLH